MTGHPWLTFFASLASSLAWPATVVALVLLFKGPLSGLIPLLHRMKVMGQEFEFGAKEARLELKGALPERPEGARESEDYLSRTLRASPRAAVMEAWLVVERAARDVLESRSAAGAEPRGWRPVEMGWRLAEMGVLRGPTRDAFDRLRQLRNSAAHAREFNITESAARDYVSAAVDLAWHIRRQLPPGDLMGQRE